MLVKVFFRFKKFIKRLCGKRETICSFASYDMGSDLSLNKEIGLDLVTSVDEVGDMSHLFMTFSGKGNHRKINLPATFDLDLHLKQYPPEKYGFPGGLSYTGLKFSKDKIYYFLGLLTSIPARNRDLIDEEGFVPINMHIIQRGIRDIKAYKDYLIDTGVIISDRFYVKGVKSICYRWSDEYFTENFSVQEVVCAHEENAYFKIPPDERIPYYLGYWYVQSQLVIDDIAPYYAYAMYQEKVNDRNRWDINHATFKKKNPLLQYHTALLNITKLHDHQYEIHIDDTVNRLHTVITNLQKTYRNFLTYNGENLVSLDIKNCQPYLSYLLFNVDFWKVGSKLPLNLYSLPEEIQKRFTVSNLTTEIIKFLEKTSRTSFEKYLELVTSGRIYEEIMKVCKITMRREIIRDEAKTLMFYMLFSSNRGQSDNPELCHMKDIFKTVMFPKVAKFFQLTKKADRSISQDKQYSRLSVLLQNIESEIILHRCCRRIWEEKGRQVPIFTIHDSIATTLEHESYVSTIMNEELTKNIGVTPILSREVWSETRLDSKLLDQIRQNNTSMYIHVPSANPI